MRREHWPWIGVLVGIRGYGRGVFWLLKTPRFLLPLFVPAVLGLIIFGNAFYWISTHYESWIRPYLPVEGAGFWLGAWYFVVKTFFLLNFFAVAILGAVLGATIIASPIYEWVSEKVEIATGGERFPPLGIIGNIRVMGTELKKALVIMAVSLIVLLVPGINVLAPLLTAFAVGSSLYDLPLARRGWSFRDRMRFVLGDFWVVMGFGLILMIPFVQILLYPLGVVGGTILCTERLRKHPRPITK